MNEQVIRERFSALGQEHLFRHWAERGEEPRRRLLRDLAALDPARLQEMREKLLEESTPPPRLEPVPYIPWEETADRRDAESAGRRCIAEGRTALLTVAGGQGSRLGFAGPKGAFPISPIRRASLFQIFAEKILAAARRYGRPLPWYIMTSPMNHDEIIEFFHNNRFFGLPEEGVRFFPQGTLPSLSPEGRLLLTVEGGLFQNPDGHGGVIDALHRHGCFEEMRAGGIEQLFYFQVDNPLVVVPDPLFLGVHLRENADVSSKVVRKVAPEEKLGAIGRVDGRPRVIEYSDLDEKNMYARDERGELLFAMGSIAIHIFRVSFLAGWTARQEGGGLRLPWHLARKKVEVFEPGPGGGRRVEREAIKLEKFIFDTIPLARSAVFYETRREEEFAPLKNRSGVDSIETCARGLIERDARWLESCGVAVPRDAAGHSRYRIEISPLYALDQQTLKEKLPDSVNKIDEDTLLA